MLGPSNAGHQAGSPLSEPREEEFFSDFLGKGNEIPSQVSGPHNPHSLLTGKSRIHIQTCPIWLTLCPYSQIAIPVTEEVLTLSLALKGAWTTCPCEHQRAGQAEKPGSRVQVQEVVKRM